MDESIKTRIAQEPTRGKLVPLVLELSVESELNDAYTLIAYKQALA